MLVYSNKDFRGMYIPKTIFSQLGITIEPLSISLRISAKANMERSENNPNASADKQLPGRKKKEATTKIKP
jgi:hypothetical protein